jgi:hypothetical protein
VSFHITASGLTEFSVSTVFGVFSFTYDRERFTEPLADYVKQLMNKYSVCTDSVKAEVLEVEEEIAKVDVRYEEPVLQKLLEIYTKRASELFEARFPGRMYSLPFRLAEQIALVIVSAMEGDDLIEQSHKSATRKMWDVLIRDYGKSIRQEWLCLKPGPVEGTSKAQRYEMLDFYIVMLSHCQNAKKFYKQNRHLDWRSLVLERFGFFSHDEIESIERLRPSELALLITGKYFKRIVGKNLGGEAELRRQLGIARAELMEESRE